MPSTGTPSSKSPRSTCGALSEQTEAGPPDRTSASGRRAAAASGVIVYGTSSEYTRHSRTRRAISCEYWPPQSTTRTGRSSGAGSGRSTTSASAAIVRRLFRDGHVVGVRLAPPRGGDPHEARAVHVLDRRRAAVAHRRPQPADQLVHDRRQRP